ncbi:uncharacterized protein Z519_09163 [Cladophialophora bantiana CBS 173.52]|uniref:ABC transmembrane type-1 domain-containing protein n=1 Tax=Cladophialophora bantiana (strain ATCC 10958 / CBS 173.52 / CDC B-1940 / NIH 8579) TaxID=1442370 RepID=A0A0D2EKM3_CLAB1|nr:uncharacterized protein Z519_09163 [Cladophialophora bantiana CBS 173.52]KIW90516.1 hypothetical protein Z519_09163 [Cladophialophora bantiana CBS 173.52]
MLTLMPTSFITMICSIMVSIPPAIPITIPIIVVMVAFIPIAIMTSIPSAMIPAAATVVLSTVVMMSVVMLVTVITQIPEFVIAVVVQIRIHIGHIVIVIVLADSGVSVVWSMLLGVQMMMTGELASDS